MKFNFIRLISCILAFSLFISCTDQTSSSDQSGQEGEISQESMDYYAAKTEEDEAEKSSKALSVRYYSTPFEIKDILRRIGAAVKSSNPGEVYFVRVLQGEKEAYIRNCGFDASGSYRFHIGNMEEDETFVGGTNFPVLEHNYEDSNFFLIEEMKIEDGGRKLQLKTRLLSYNGEGYEIDMAIPSEPMDLIALGENGLILTDRINEAEDQRFFMLNSFYEKLPERNCEEAYE